MTTVKVRGMVESDGRLKLDVPVGLPAGAADVVVVVQPDAAEPPRDPRPAGSSRSGLLVGDPALAALDIDAALREMNDAWKAKLADVL